MMADGGPQQLQRSDFKTRWSTSSLILMDDDGWGTAVFPPAFFLMWYEHVIHLTSLTIT